ncbi:MAG: sigma-70 family RNA polymerase sigma factor [Thermoanaerobaculia bacterium]
MATAEHEITRLLEAAAGGNDRALEDLFVCVYAQLRRLAHMQRARWRGDETLCTTALVHEAYLRLSQQHQFQWENRAHFFNAASKAMRHILVDYARKQKAAKRGGEKSKVPADSVPLVADDAVEELLALNEALDRLGELDERQSRVVECRFFAGLGIEETAEALGVSTRTVKRDWRSAQAWLYRELTRIRTGTLPRATPNHL